MNWYGRRVHRWTCLQFCHCRRRLPAVSPCTMRDLNTYLRHIYDQSENSNSKGRRHLRAGLSDFSEPDLTVPVPTPGPSPDPLPAEFGGDFELPPVPVPVPNPGPIPAPVFVAPVVFVLVLVFGAFLEDEDVLDVLDGSISSTCRR